MTGRKWLPALVAVTVVGGASCQRTPPPGPAAAQARPAAPASPPASFWRPFEPPADGRLTLAQVEMYIAVRRRALALSKNAPAPASPAAAQLADLAASERRAAGELGLDVDEWRWVNARVAEASPPAAEGLGSLASAVEAAGRAGREQVLEKTEKGRLPVAPAEPGPDDAARADNRALLGQHRSEIDGLRPPPALSPPPAGLPGS